jgi:hypothetical protein
MASLDDLAFLAITRSSIPVILNWIDRLIVIIGVVRVDR